DLLVPSACSSELHADGTSKSSAPVMICWCHQHEAHWNMLMAPADHHWNMLMAPANHLRQ
ncbi:hypothetical protein PS021_24590, partial [Shigella sonnei]|nr:hypothetical protein [Shigella sonnei]